MFRLLALAPRIAACIYIGPLLAYNTMHYYHRNMGSPQVCLKTSRQIYSYLYSSRAADEALYLFKVTSYGPGKHPDRDLLS